MATMHAKRAVADTVIRRGARALVAVMRESDKRAEQLRNCEQRNGILVQQKNDLIDENGILRGVNGDYNRKVKRKNRKLRILLIPATYGVLKAAQPLIPQLSWLP